MDTSQLGIWTATLDAQPLSRVKETVAELDSQGWHSLWYSETFGREALSTALLLLDWSTTIRVGTGIANIYGRDALGAASLSRTIEALYPGRFTLGLGVSHAPLVSGVRGHTYGKPIAAMTEYLTALNNSPAIVPGEPQLPEILIAALGPRMLKVARELTQGAHPYLTTPSHTAFARETLGTEPKLVVEMAAVIDPAADKDEWQSRAHKHLSIYTGLPNYRGSFIRQGFTNDDLVIGGSDTLQTALVAHGVEATLNQAQAHLDAGATEVVVQVLGNKITEPPISDWRLLHKELS